MSLADAIAIARAIAVAPIAYLVIVERSGAALAVFVIAAMTDAADGWVARRSSGATALGELLDPLADKVLVLGTLIALSAAGTGWPVTVVTVLVGVREGIVVILRIRAFARGVALPAGRTAKLKTVAEMAGTALIILGGRPWAVLGAGLVGLAFLAGLVTLPRYLSAARRAV